MAVSFAKRRVSRSMKIGLISTPTTSETPNRRADKQVPAAADADHRPGLEAGNRVGEVGDVVAEEGQLVQIAGEAIDRRPGTAVDVHPALLDRICDIAWGRPPERRSRPLRLGRP